MGHPSTLVLAECLTADASTLSSKFYNDIRNWQRLTHKTEGGACIWLKREGLDHTGAHQIGNAILLAKHLYKRRIIPETSADQHGVATATTCAKLGVPCIVYMATEDMQRCYAQMLRR
ncbi:tryptophan synthase beta subunit-like PLP-dependent enzyme [Jimgerdemannia flammicorona]|nr:tryptophan synthase beta subunit-like PLP-dependent enzyme [Jimgerdemannia flammicorona]